MQRFGEAFIRGYRRIRRLAAGPVSELYLAESEQAGALVVLKSARDQQAQNELDSSFRRFLQEYEIVQRIRHPGVVRLYDLGVSDEHAYLVMEYFPAGDLRRRMRSPMTAGEALRIALEIARALDGIHQAGVLHRDLKPGNVMMRDDGSLALIDFGLAKDAALAMEVTDHGVIFGTPHYMSPEQGHGEPIDARSDLYSLGVLLFEMLAREKPFLSENPMAIIYKHRKEPIPSLPEAMAAFQPLVSRLLGKTPDERFPNAAAAAEAIRAAAREHLSEELAA
jgi:serine/threonine protein kinase